MFNLKSSSTCFLLRDEEISTESVFVVRSRSLFLLLFITKKFGSVQNNISYLYSPCSRKSSAKWNQVANVPGKPIGYINEWSRVIKHLWRCYMPVCHKLDSTLAVCLSRVTHVMEGALREHRNEWKLIGSSVCHSSSAGELEDRFFLLTFNSITFSTLPSCPALFVCFLLSWNNRSTKSWKWPPSFCHY